MFRRPSSGPNTLAKKSAQPFSYVWYGYVRIYYYYYYHYYHYYYHAIGSMSMLTLPKPGFDQGLNKASPKIHRTPATDKL